MVSAGLRSLDISFFDGNMFRQVTMSCNSDIVINSMKLLYDMEW